MKEPLYFHIHFSLASHSASVLNWNSLSHPTPQRHSMPEDEPVWLLRSRRHPLAISSWSQQSLKSSEMINVIERLYHP